MEDLTIKEFASFYKEIHSDGPYPWQIRLAKYVIDNEKWPERISIPTGCGKTSCIDIAIYALACKPKRNPRRIVFTVNRRVIVDSAHERAKRIACCLSDPPEKSVLHKVKSRLCDIAGSKTALNHVVLRGGTRIDKEWHNSPVQPCVISATVDHAGSRLLFRGYGTGKASRVVDAGLLGHDCLWILDETHISSPFTETLKRVDELRKMPWVKKELSRPWGVVEMTATPINHAAGDFRLSDDDRNHPHISAKIEASKMCDLIKSNAKNSDDAEPLAKDLTHHALKMQHKYRIETVAIIANRIATAKHAYNVLKSKGHRTHLIIGRMRPIDRDRLMKDLAHLKTGVRSSRGRTKNGQLADNLVPEFVVSTQCLEVGADLDFGGMVSEASSLDSLRQRFGRLNRNGTKTNARGAIVAPLSTQRGRCDDPIYGDSMNRTWAFLCDGKKRTIDIGITKMDEVVKKYVNKSELMMREPDRQLLLPSHMDLLCQTHSHLHTDPDINPFLHGFERGTPTVSVVWRAGLYANTAERMIRALPPRSTEAMQVPLWDIKQHLKNTADLTGGDVEWQRPTSMREETSGAELRYALLYEGHGRRKNIKKIDGEKFDRLKTGDVVMLPTEDQGWADLGHIPEEYRTVNTNGGGGVEHVDIAERAAMESTGIVTIRMGDAFPTKMTEVGKQLISALKEEETQEKINEIKNLLALSLMRDNAYFKSGAKNQQIKHNVELVDNDSIIITIEKRKPTPSNASDGELEQHIKNVEERISAYLEKLGMANDFLPLMEKVAEMHDAGKADKRFQRMLYRTMHPPPTLRAKDNGKETKQKYYPKGFRHEFVSSMLAKNIDVFDKELFMHLIESHHGHCRPFVPVIIDDEAENVYYEWGGTKLKANPSTGLERVGSGAAKRFWMCVRKYGWWGLAWLEALFLLADWDASGEFQR